ncbi:hypothetical protein PPUJ20066_10900 [Pseudomonas putida]|nr:hypothetical protein PPUJ20066_10900 [Pseudomonas putida]
MESYCARDDLNDALNTGSLKRVTESDGRFEIIKLNDEAVRSRRKKLQRLEHTINPRPQLQNYAAVHYLLRKLLAKP